MKQSIKIFAAFLFLSVGFTSISFAQNAYASNEAKNSITVTNISEKLPNKDVVTTEASPAMENRLLSLFPAATEQKWSITNENSFVSFLNNGSKATASFDSKGKLSYVITACTIHQVPEAFSKAIANNYAGYQLFHAIEIKAYGETVYQAIIENADGFRTLKYTTDGVEEIKYVKK